MHGEYKVPGGKLVIADFEVSDGKLARVSINGDFFLEPPEALDDITRSLEGASAEASEQDLTRRVQSSLPEGAEMIGFDPESVAAAVRRGLS